MNIPYTPQPVEVHPCTIKRRERAVKVGAQKRVWPDDRSPLGCFMSKICYAGDCIVWTGYVNEHGYGVTIVNQRHEYAHRFAFEMQYGPIPQGLVLDHICRNPICVNPAHLEAVTQKVNTYRGKAVEVWKQQSTKTHCTNGHELTGENVYREGPDGRNRRCRICKNAAHERYVQRIKAQKCIK